jgi:NADH-quinone oxidoreductase subunit C
MNDENPTPPPEMTDENKADEKLNEDTAPDAPTPPESEQPAEKRQPLSEEEKAAKIAEAKARAAANKAAEDAEPKPPWEEKPVPPEHEDVTDDEDAAALENEMPGVVLAADRYAGDVTLTVPAEKVVEICRFLKEDRDYRFLVDLTAVDWPEREEGRFDVVYWMHRHADSKRLRLSAVISDEVVGSVVSVWKTANWMEREVYDLFGIVFEGHPGLERILTWEGFNGHPLRKDFPVEGIDTGAAIYPDVYPPGGGPPPDDVEEEEEGGAS